jgi:hypothetical protein
MIDWVVGLGGATVVGCRIMALPLRAMSAGIVILKYYYFQSEYSCTGFAIEFPVEGIRKYQLTYENQRFHTGKGIQYIPFYRSMPHCVNRGIFPLSHVLQINAKIGFSCKTQLLRRILHIACLFTGMLCKLTPK